MQPQTQALIRYLGDVFLAFVAIMFVAGLGSILGLTLSATVLLPVFLGPAYLFFVLAGSGVGYFVNRRRCSRAAPWMWVLPAIWSGYEGARDLSSGIHDGDRLLGYIWNTLILGNHELGMISQWVIGAPFVTSLAYSFGACLALFGVGNSAQSPLLIAITVNYWAITGDPTRNPKTVPRRGLRVSWRCYANYIPIPAS